MKKQLPVLLLAVLLCTKLFAQDDWLPNRTLSSSVNANLCDNAPWKLVFYDDFNGTTLDSTKWVTFTPWFGMPKPQPGGGTINHDFEIDQGVRKSGGWTEDTVHHYNATNLARNVVVGGGKVKLKVKHEAATIDGHTEYYTTGQIATRYFLNGQKKSFNSGKFEVRMTMPDFHNTHTTLWTWFGRYIGVNEIDMAESYGPERSGHYNGNPFTFKYYQTKMNHPTHAWGRTDLDTFQPPLPYHWDYDATQHVNDVRYPRQKYTNWLAGNYLYINEPYTYTCEWDTTVIRFYLDHQEINTMWKYFKWVPYSNWGSNYLIPVGSGCSPDGEYEVTYGFPYRRDSSECNFRISTGVNMAHGAPTTGVTELGEAEIDYVKIYQRHPEHDGYTEICNSSSTIIGPSSVCGTATYTVVPFMPGGTWTVGNNTLNITGTANNGNTVTVQTNTTNPAPVNVAQLTYNYTPPGCPPNQISKVVNNGTVNNQVVSCLQNINLTKMWFALQVLNPVAGATYEWTVNYSHPAAGSFSYHGYGHSIQTPKFFHHFINYYNISWTLKVTNGCGYRLFNGSKNVFQYKAPSFAKPDTYIEKDGSAIYLQTRMNEQDSIDLEQNVRNMLRSKMVESVDDTIAINSMICDAYMTCLEPYIYFDDMDTSSTINSAVGLNLNKKDMKSMVFPNPASGQLAVALGTLFAGAEKISYKIIDLNGRLVDQAMLSAICYINIEKLSTGAYILELSTGDKLEQVKFYKM